MVRARGRGRGAGRGGGRGRATRGGRFGRRGRPSLYHQRHTQEAGQYVDEDAKFVSTERGPAFDNEVRSLFVGGSNFKQHFDAQDRIACRYAAILGVLETRGVQIKEAARPRALAAAWARKDYDLANLMLGIPEEKFGLKEVLKAVSILDAGRNKRAHEKKLKRLEAQGCKKKGKMAQIKSLIGSLAVEVPHTGSVSGALIRHVKKWVKSLPGERLEFYAMHFPTEPWKKLADICHLNPKEDFPNCMWFLPYCYGQPAPSGTVVGDVGKLTKENISEMVMGHEVDYTVARQYHEHLTVPAKQRIALYTAKLDTIIWYYEELGCPPVDKVIKERLEKGEKLGLPYGKLMERLLTFKMMKDGQTSPPYKPDKSKGEELLPFIELLIPAAEEHLKTLSLPLEAPVAILGDMSGSMDVAIRTSNIIASLLTAVAKAQLVFFDDRVEIPDFMPSTVREVLELSSKIRARGGTSPAVGLWHFYDKKIEAKTFVVVTDEGENTNCHGYNFARLFKKYHDEIYPARLVFISFLSSQMDEGQMIRSLKQTAPEIKPMQFRFDYSRPDLTKLDNVFGLLSTEMDTFTEEVDKLEKTINENGLASALDNMKV